MTPPETKSAAGSVGTVDTQFLDLPEPLALECGRSCFRSAWPTRPTGRCRRRRDNVVLVCHALSGDAHAAGIAATPAAESTRDGFRADERDGGGGRGLGWWDGMIGPARRSTPTGSSSSARICSEAAAAPRDRRPRTRQPAGPKGRTFQSSRSRTWCMPSVRSCTRLGITRLAAVAGGSLGGMQALEWAVQSGDHVGAIIPIASTHALHPQGVAWNAIARTAITADPDWQGGHYYGTGRAPTAGMGIARMVGHITYLSAEVAQRQVRPAPPVRRRHSLPAHRSRVRGRELPASPADTFVKRFDANTYLYTSRALSYFDLARQHGAASSRTALRNVSARTLLIAFRSDWLYPPAGSEELAAALRAAARRSSSMSSRRPYGHDCFCWRRRARLPMIQEFLGGQPLGPEAMRNTRRLWQMPPAGEALCWKNGLRRGDDGRMP